MHFWDNYDFKINIFKNLDGLKSTNVKIPFPFVAASPINIFTPKGFVEISKISYGIEFKEIIGLYV